jgi:2'-5' RNA ligase
MVNITYGVSSDLTGEAYAAARSMWDGLERRYGLRAARAAIHPHITYVVGECPRPQSLVAALAGVAAALPAFETEIDGFGIFDGPSPVVYLRVLKNPPLIHAYQTICQSMQNAGLTIWDHYQEQSWTPHVTLALRDLPADLLPLVLADLQTRPARFTTRLEVVNLVHVVQPEHVYLATLPLRSNEG